MITLSLCLAFYRNQGMLTEQLRVWAGYPDDVKARVEVIIIDDGSPEAAIDVSRPAGLPTVTIGRLADVADPFTPPWRQDAARNRAAHEAVGTWLFLSDMDHVLPADSLRALLARCDAGQDVVYSFQRLDAPDLTPKRDARGNIHPHPNTYAMRKTRYWSVGGFDEEFCGIYGTDGYWRRQLLDRSTLVHLETVPVVRYSREVIPDASTRVDRNQFRDDGRVRRRLVEKQLRQEPTKVLSVPWQRQLRAEAA